MESIRNLEHRGYPGHYHHRWLVELQKNAVVFRFKTPLMSSSWRCTLPISEDKVAEELEAFVRRLGVFPDWRYRVERARAQPRARVKRFSKRTKRFRALADRPLGRRMFVDEEQLWPSLPDHQSK